MQMKTYQDWNTASTLTSYLNPEDEIDQEMVNYFCEKLPPQTMTSTVIQIGEPYNHYMDKSRKWHPVFPTIKRIKDQWIYKGLCFSGDTKQARHHIFITKVSENNDFNYKFFRNLCFPKLYYLWHKNHW